MPDEKKLIIDEDWKAQVEAEKRKTQKPGDDSGEESAAGAPPRDARDLKFPPASFELLLTTLATEALVALGQVPNPITGAVEAHRDQARYLIDTIEMLQQKTKGNLTPQEQLAIDNLLHQLRMAFVESE
jgi:hypothetical protein